VRAILFNSHLVASDVLGFVEYKRISTNMCRILKVSVDLNILSGYAMCLRVLQKIRANKMSVIGVHMCIHVEIDIL
jgi:hypothetical protein